MYMSYCRYEGTAAELNVCLEDVREHVYEEAEYEVSDREITNFKHLVTRFHEFMQEMTSRMLRDTFFYNFRNISVIHS